MVKWWKNNNNDDEKWLVSWKMMMTMTTKCHQNIIMTFLTTRHDQLSRLTLVLTQEEIQEEGG